MANDFDNSSTNFLKHLHEFIDWTHRWGSPHTSREETAYFDIQAKILENKTSLKPFVHRLRLTLETFLDDFRKEPDAETRIGNDFVAKGMAVIDMIEPCKPNLSDEDKGLIDEVKKLIGAAIKQVKAHANA